jgi:2-methylcitrate dehydratase PrpD
VLEPKGDPGNTLSRQELEEKAVQLALYRGGATKQEMTGAIERIWTLPQRTRVAHLIARTAVAGPRGLRRQRP